MGSCLLSSVGFGKMNKVRCHCDQFLFRNTILGKKRNSILVFWRELLQFQTNKKNQEWSQKFLGPTKPSQLSSGMIWRLRLNSSSDLLTYSNQEFPPPLDSSKNKKIRSYQYLDKSNSQHSWPPKRAISYGFIISPTAYLNFTIWITFQLKKIKTNNTPQTPQVCPANQNRFCHQSCQILPG